ncbi:MAG: PilZ domain-containing protein [Candidatus Omnitrophota bacterium]
MQERRIFERFNMSLPVTFVDLNTNEEGTGSIVNISAGGGGLILMAKNLPPATPLELCLHIPDSKDPFYARGNIIWSKKIKSNTYKAGVQFDKVDFMGIARILRVRS